MQLKVKYLGLIALSITAVALLVYNYYTPKFNTLVSMTAEKPADIARKPVRIIFNTIPKSASVFIAKTFEVGLGCHAMQISQGYFPQDNITYSAIDKFYNEPCVIAKAHMNASAFNQQLLKKYTDKIVVQFRDPREVLLSWVHYINRIHAENKVEYLYHVVPTPPEAYYGWEQSRQIDWHIENFLPEVVTWMQGWVDFKAAEDARQDGFKVMITTYDEFKQNELAFYNSILSFYAIPEAQFVYAPQKRDMELHFRRGDQNEWRQVFTAAQKHKIASIVPESLLKRFAWN